MARSKDPDFAAFLLQFRSSTSFSEVNLVPRCFQWVAADDWEPRRGEKLKAQGHALGKVHGKIRALKGRNYALVSPLQGETISSLRFPGRCPGLSNFALSGLLTSQLSTH